MVSQEQEVKLLVQGIQEKVFLYLHKDHALKITFNMPSNEIRPIPGAY